MSNNPAMERSKCEGCEEYSDSGVGHQPVGSETATGRYFSPPIGGEPMADRKQNHLWWTVAVILIILWLPGLMGRHTVGGLIRILLLLALVVVLFRIIQRRRPA
jgi:hypothetical protein